MSNRTLARFEGRLFVDDGRLCMVVEADESTGIGRVSTRIDGKQTLLEMPLVDIAMYLSSGAKLVLDNLGSPESKQRVLEKEDGWFFSAREGLKGPFPSGEHAERELDQYIIASQGA